MTIPLPELDGVEHRFIDAGGLRMHVAEAGAGEPVVLLHGWPQHWWEWRGLIPRLAESYRVICPDLRGFGWSDAPPRGYEKEQLADDVLALLDALDLDRVRLVGHDWGGYVGFLLCIRRPERFERFLALNTGHPFVPVDLRTVAAMWRFWYQVVIATPLLGRWVVRTGFSRLLYRWWTARGTAWSPEDIELFAAPLREPARAAASVQIYRTFQTRELPAMARGRYRHQRLRTPTLFLHGADDPVIRPSLLRGFEAHADDMRLELVDGTGHFIVDEQPDLVLERALAFFES
jgi:pimeloyl-ACP methyl ester carboxylesterase